MSLTSTATDLVKTLLPNTANYYLVVSSCQSPLSVVEFTEEAQISQPYKLTITLTSPDADINVEDILNQRAQFDICCQDESFDIGLGRALPVTKVVRSSYGIISEFKRIKSSMDETTYQVCLEPQFSTLKQGQYSAVYQNKNVIDIVSEILQTRHGYKPWMMNFEKVDNFNHLPLEMEIQHQQSDYTFITELLSNAGIWFNFLMDDKLKREIIVFSDGASGYDSVEQTLPLSTPSSLLDDSTVSAWDLHATHKVVENDILVKDNNYRQAYQSLEANASLHSMRPTRSGTFYHYGDNVILPYEGQAAAGIDDDKNPIAESSDSYAKKHHIRLLSEQTQLTGQSNAPNLAVGQIIRLTSTSTLPKAYANGIIITEIHSKGSRKESYHLTFTGIPNQAFLYYLPPLVKRKEIHGTIPARISNRDAADRHAAIDQHGRYKVRFDFDLSTQWEKGFESGYLRLARNYAGDKHGLHLPLLNGASVLVAFENSDTRKAYISQVLHDSRHQDVVTSRNHKRNILNTPANNRLILDDSQDNQFVQLSTEHSGKSQLNLGQLVDETLPTPNPRGRGFELRTDAHGAIRAGAGILISTEQQTQGNGEQLDMQDAINQLESALRLAYSLQGSAQAAGAADNEATEQQQLNEKLNQLKQASLLLYADKGIAQATPESVHLSSGKDILINAGQNGNINIFKKCALAVGQGISLFTRTLGIKLVAAKDNIQLQAQKGKVEVMADQALHLSSLNDVVHIDAKNGLQLTCGGGGIRILKNGAIELFSPQSITYHAPKWQFTDSQTTTTQAPTLTSSQLAYSFALNAHQDKDTLLTQQAFRIYTANGQKIDGVTDDKGQSSLLDMLATEQATVELIPTEQEETF